MMLLTAVVLIIGFVALAGMVARVSQLAGQAAREQNRPMLREVEPMLGAVNDAIATGLPGATPPVVAGTAAFDDALVDVLRHLRATEAGQSILLDWTIVCTPPTAPATQWTGYASLTLNDGFLQVTVASSLFNRPTACTTLSG